MKREYLGSALVDYIVPTAVVGLVVGLGVYGLFESGSLTRFFAASGNIDIDGGTATINKFDNTGSPLVSSGGDTTSTPTTPTTGGGSGTASASCTAGSCDIDLGGYVLTGVPEDFGEYIESSGNAGGTEMLATLLEQIAEDPSLSSSESSLIKELANLGHSTAAFQEDIEEMADGISSSNYSSWVRDGWRSAENVNYDDKLDSVLSSLSGISNSNIREVVSILGNEIVTVNENFVEKCGTIQENLDVLNSGSGIAYTIEELTYSLLNPKASEVTDLDSAIICKTGDGTDSGTQCN